MIKQIAYKIFGTRNERLLKQYRLTVSKINKLEPSIKKLTNEELQQKTIEFKNRFNNGETLNQLLVEVFAVCREASLRVLNMRHFDVQLIGGMVLNDGKISEMRTGEGKTLSATLAAYLNAISGKGVHVVTVNDYLAKRDATEMGKLYNFLGLSVGVNLPNLSTEEKRQAYSSDITYGTNNEFGFDYLRDNMVFDLKDKVQRPLNFAIVDEVDSILIDEARTPLIISGPAEGTEELYIKLNQVPSLLNKQELEDSREGDFWIDEKNNNVVLSEAGHVKVEKILIQMGLLDSGESLYNVQNISLLHHLLAALKAHYVFIKDQHYVVQNNEVVIVDEFTGRLMDGRRWSDGLHQAVEAKEGVEIQKENQTMASITFQNYFRMYGKLSGMTGTADTEAYEFQQIYSLETVIVPPNRTMVRLDYNDKIYLNMQDKYNALIADIQIAHAKGQPILVGTTSVETSELLSSLLTKANLKHQVLNAKHHAREADIVAQAGAINAITVATNMAGRGTDIILGGNIKPQIEKIKQDSTLNNDQKEGQISALLAKWSEDNKKVLELGGLFIIGTERHESRRIDNQLRGRAGRQGDAGASRFYLSLDDSLLRIFGGDRMRGMMQKLGMEKGEAIEHKWLSKSIESAQRKVEGHNFDIRKQLLDYDDVANDQRKVIYHERDQVLQGSDLFNLGENIINSHMSELFDIYVPPKSSDVNWEMDEFTKFLHDNYKVDFNIKSILKDNPQIREEEIKELFIKEVHDLWLGKVKQIINNVENDVKRFVRNVIVLNDDNQINIDSVKALDAFIEQNAIRTDIDFTEYVKQNSSLSKDELIDFFNNEIKDLGSFQASKFVRSVFIQHMDYFWREHLTNLEQLRQGIHLRGYAQKDPKQEYKHESFNLFSTMLDNIKQDIVKVLLTVQINGINDIPSDEEVEETPIIDSEEVLEKTISRNSVCYCGSGKKYKHCHGKLV